jgi:glycosyltransferase involved in cell wall biosynthesis
MLPFGPACSIESLARTEVLRQTAGIIAVSHYLKNYIRQWGGMDAAVLPISLFGCGPFPSFGDFDKGYVMMINPCAEKGMSIFCELARKLPNVQFGAVPTWGTKDTDLAVLKQLPNVRLFMPVDNVEEIFARSRVLLVPSLWAEAKARVVLEAMLRGIPVLASNIGGNPEAKLGIDYLLPVHPVKRYEEQRIGEEIDFVPVVPEQDVRPWLAALREVLSDRIRYEQISDASRKAALAFIENNGIELVEEFLENIVQSFQPNHQTVSIQNTEQPTRGVPESIRRLSPKQRELLVRRLSRKGGKQKEASNT